MSWKYLVSSASSTFSLANPLMSIFLHRRTTVAGEVKDSLASSYTVYSSTFFGYFRIYSRTWFSAAERLR